ncbi:hypothetical protein F2Q70_00010575 [Brassica cretica]|uniref:Uncharacterized protein n=1 Tax=Brassica cretica TaxID=69181 RepID=A0A8S9M1K3_BRACR|nr:hypothetical protein F2Q70_00010575 [Brassica cretica]
MHTDEYDEDFEDERAIEYRAIIEEEGKLLHHSSWKRNANRSTGQASHRSTLSLNNNAESEHRPTLPTTNRSTLSSTMCEMETTRLVVGQMNTTRRALSIDKHPQQSIDINNTTSIDNHPILKTTVSEKVKLDNQYLTPDEFGIFRDSNGFAKAIDGCTLHVSREDIADILQTTNGVDNMFMHQRSKHKTTKEFNDTAGGIDNSFNQQSRHTTHPSINTDAPTIARQPEFSRRAYDLYDGRTIPVHTKDIKRLLERASRDKPAYICLPEHASSFTQTKLVLEIYTKDEINEMF